MAVMALPQGSTDDVPDIEEPFKLGIGAPCIRAKHLCQDHLRCCYSHANANDTVEYGKCIPLDRECL
ncbi:hypothetical protein ONZ45_g9634 [Pleurotus djamor]|nr:hypothetical protein ONZ45_g9634 [Pleurotus djamor]